MPQTCQHCGVRLPAVVDAYCPNCRQDLSETPEEVIENRLSWEKVDRAFAPQRAALDGGCVFMSIPSTVAGLGTALATKDVAATADAVIGIAILCLTGYAAYRRLNAAPDRHDQAPN